MVTDGLIERAKLPDGRKNGLSLTDKEQYPAPPMEITENWTLSQVLGYISTWSAVRQVENAGRPEILHAFAADLAADWGDPAATRRVTWPLTMKLGIVTPLARHE